jgi:LuxR family maltose regulon positive regulatory protein
LARLKLARGDLAGAAAMLAETEQSARQNSFVQRLPEVAAVQVLVLLRQGQGATVAQPAQQYELPLSWARVRLAPGDAEGALAVLAAYHQQVEARGCADERLKAMVLQALALHACSEKDAALQRMGEALALAEPAASSASFWMKASPCAG